MQNSLKTSKKETDIIKNEFISFCTSCKSDLNSIYNLGIPSFAKENLENCKSPNVNENINVVNEKIKENLDQNHDAVKKSNNYLILDHKFTEGKQSNNKCEDIEIRNGFKNASESVKFRQKDALKVVKGYQLQIETCNVQEMHTRKKMIVTNFIHYRIKAPHSNHAQMYNYNPKNSTNIVHEKYNVASNASEYVDVLQTDKTSSELYCNNIPKDINNDILLNGNKINSSTSENLENQHTTSKYIESTVRNSKIIDEHRKENKVHILRVDKPIPVLGFKTVQRNTLNRRKNVFNLVNRLSKISSYIEDIRKTLLTKKRTDESMKRKSLLSNKGTIELLHHDNIIKDNIHTNVINTQDQPMYSYNPLHSRNAL